MHSYWGECAGHRDDTVYMYMAEQKSIAVVGAGLVGPLQALFLAQAGFEVHMYERRTDFRGTSE